MKKKNRTAISPTRAENYPEWYQQVIQAADLAESSPVRGCMVIKPWGYAIWENMQALLDAEFKATGHVNAYFPLLIPLSFMQKEAEHIEGFAKECAVVTHHRLESHAGQLQPAGELEEPFVIRPTSETVIGTQFAKWIQSYRDLPLLINQWANVMRWEMRTRLFLRTSEFLWQEGHTAHASKDEAMTETLKMLDIYADFAEQCLAIPVIKGEKTAEERFPGAENTFTIEAMMQDKKALQAATSHFLGQNFAKSFNITYSSQTESLQHVWTTSWGLSTRMIGALIMTHSDDNGLVLPPRIAPNHVVICPIYRNEDDRQRVLSYCQQLQEQLRGLSYHHKPLLVKIDDRDINGGEKTWSHIKKGTPIRVEIGPRDLENNAVCVGQRHLPAHEKTLMPLSDFLQNVCNLLDTQQQALYDKAWRFREQHTKQMSSLEEFKQFFTGDQQAGFAKVYSIADESVAPHIKPLKVSARCIPLQQSDEQGVCIFSGKPTKQQVIYAKAY